MALLNSEAAQCLFVNQVDICTLVDGGIATFGEARNRGILAQNTKFSHECKDTKYNRSRFAAFSI